MKDHHSELENVSSDPAYRALYETFALSTSPIVAVVGSGMSAPAGLPTWPALKKHLVEVLQKKAASSDADFSRDQLAAVKRVASTDSYWLSFQLLQQSLGQATYSAEVRSALSSGDTSEIPEAYEALWRTQVQGVLTLNLDSLAKRAFSNVSPGVELKAFVGKEAARLSSLLHGTHRFLYNLHGILDDSDSWVFTRPQLEALLKGPSYQNLLRTIFSTYTVVFLGISADDTAIGSPLEKLAAWRIQGRTHYWITDRRDSATDKWAEGLNIRVIRYPSQNGHGVIKEILDDLKVARVGEQSPPPVISPNGIASTPLLSPDELVTRPTDEIRQALNGHAAKLLEETGGPEKFAEFLSEYDEAVHRAWYSTDKAPKNVLFGNTLLQEVKRGAFGRVYRAVDKDGVSIAVKVLLTELRSDVELLHSFRRGVQAMRILKASRVPGMVSYMDASEVPAFVTMDWIEGPNLAEAKNGNYIDEWDVVLWLSLELATVLKTAHQLPERVLHRDVRPANVMLRDGWVYPDYHDWQLVVLDFDLSTFRGAREKSVLSEGSALGFLAPEQLDPRSTYSTRSALVDSFGFGMTLLFLCSGQEPEAYSQRRADYSKVVRDATRRLQDARWQSLPKRVERLIICCTTDNQSLRWDMSQVIREIDRLKKAQDQPDLVKDVDLLAEELVTRSRIGQDYEWNIDTETATSHRPDGLVVQMRGSVVDEVASLRLEWASKGDESRGSLTKYLPDKILRATSALKAGGWRKVFDKNERHSFRIEAELPYQELVGGMPLAVRSLDSALAELQLTMW